MRNVFLNRFDEILVVNIKSKNIEKLLNNIYKLNINIFNLEKISYKEINIEILQKDLNKIKKLSVLNKINVIEYKGKLKVTNNIKHNKILLFSLGIGLLLLMILTNIIFKIEVIHTSSDLKEFLYNELEENGIRAYQFKKSYKKLQQIKNNIIDDNKDKIEWLEIERVGTKYIIRLEERKLVENSEDYIYQDIIAKRDAVIKRINASSGVIIHQVNDYVKKGDIIISGKIYLYDTLKGYTKATGEVYGEVWYKTSIEYPIINNIKHETGNVSTVYSINILNKRITVGKSFKNSNINKKIIFKNNILPFSISKDNEYEVKIIDGIYSEGEAVLSAKKYAERKVKEMLDKDEYIISDKVLNYRVNSNTIYMDIFYKIYSNIGENKEIIIEEGE